jgi:hypothetical protein
LVVVLYYIIVSNLKANKSIVTRRCAWWSLDGRWAVM